MQRLWDKVQKRGENECWPWLGATDTYGRGRININRKAIIPTRLILELEGFPEPEAPNNKALHQPGCSPGCCNPKHLRWGSQKDNMQDKILNGKSRHSFGAAARKSHLTDDDVYAIRASNETLKWLSRRYGVSERSIWDIKKRRSWSHI